MEHTYTVRGADGSDYGPVNFEQLTGWIREGRLLAHSEIRRSDMEHWAGAGDFAELKTTFQPAPAAAAAPAIGTPGVIAPATPATATMDLATASKLKSGASWFYWIAGLSLINTIAAFSGSDWRFIVGLGITQVFDALGNEFGGAGKVIVLLLDLFVAGMFIAFGVFANKGHLWAFITGMVLFALDGILFVLAQEWIGVAFHAFVLYCFFRGMQACRELKAG